MMERLGAPQTHLGLKTMIKEVDEDGDGAISFRYSSDPPDKALNFVKHTQDSFAEGLMYWKYNLKCGLYRGDYFIICVSSKGDACNMTLC